MLDCLLRPIWNVTTSLPLDRDGSRDKGRFKLRNTCWPLPFFPTAVDMSDPPPGKQSKKSQLLRPLKGLFSRLHSRSPSSSRASISVNDAISAPQASYLAQSIIPHNEKVSASPTIGATSASQASYQGVNPHNATASISASPTNDTASVPQVIPQGTEYTAILDLPTTPSTPLTWEHRMKECGSTAYEGLKMAIQGIYDFSGSFPPLQTTAGALLTISKLVDVRGSLFSTCKYTNNISPIRGFLRIGRILNNLG